MALTSGLLAPAGSSGGTQSNRADLSASVSGTTSTAEIDFSAYQYFAINANGDINIRFGPTGLPAATAADFRIPANSTYIYPVSKQNQAIRIYNPGGTSITYWIQPLVAQL